MICGACSNPAAVEITPLLSLCERCERALKGSLADLSFLNTCCGPLAVSPATKQSPMGMSDCRGDQNSPGYAAVNADQLGCEGNRLSRRPDRDEGPWTAGGVTAGETASNSVSASTPRGESGGFTTAPGSHRVVEAAAVIEVPAGATPQEDRLALSPPAHPVRGPVTNSDISIPGFLRRDSENLAAWMRGS